MVKFRVVQKIDELALYQNAMVIFESQKEETTFEQIVEALKETGNNLNLAKEILEKKAQAKKALTQSQFATAGDNDDDLYS